MTPSHAATEFLSLHIKRTVMQWSWHFSESLLRATSAHRTATIGRCELDDLFEAGLMEQGPGVSVRATPKGRAWLAAKEAAQPAILRTKEVVS
ncbi:hypothetical protein ACRAVF_19145 [Bradyrhizobium oligotrophicum S58]